MKICEPYGCFLQFTLNLKRMRKRFDGLAEPLLKKFSLIITTKLMICLVFIHDSGILPALDLLTSEAFVGVSF